MNASSAGSAPLGVVHALVAAVNAHDLHALTGVFAEDYRNETPAHPFRSFAGRGQVRRNWATMLGGAPDLTMQLLTAVADGNRVWAELAIRGTRLDGSAHELAGVCIFTVVGGEIMSGRFYLEPVERTSGNVDDAVRRQVTGGLP